LPLGRSSGKLSEGARAAATFLLMSMQHASIAQPCEHLSDSALGVWRACTRMY
jgi:hypothetical protein